MAKLKNHLTTDNEIIFGRLIYNKKVSEYKEHKKFFNELAQQVIDFCIANVKDYHIKTGTIKQEN